MTVFSPANLQRVIVLSEQYNQLYGVPKLVIDHSSSFYNHHLQLINVHFVCLGFVFFTRLSYMIYCQFPIILFSMARHMCSITILNLKVYIIMKSYFIEMTRTIGLENPHWFESTYSLGHLILLVTCVDKGNNNFFFSYIHIVEIPTQKGKHFSLLVFRDTRN